MVKNKLSLLLIFIIMAIPVELAAQSPEEIESQMDMIKLDETMIYGESYHDDKEIAYGNAMGELLITANELRAESGLEPITTSCIHPVVKKLMYSKGGRHVVMLYIPISMMMSLSSGSHLDETAQDHIQIIPQKEISPETEREDSTETDIPVSQSVPIYSASQYGADEILDALCGQDNWVEIKDFLRAFKAQGKISSTGAVTMASEIPEDACSILIDDMGGILSILSPKNSSARINYRTNQPDEESNYINCKFIVWYK